MIDIEKIIKGIESCLSPHDPDCNLCPYDSIDLRCKAKLRDDVMILLKEQEAREPHYTTLRYLVNGTEIIVHHPECPRCIENGLALYDAEIEKGQAYCKRCGQAVRWDD